MQKEVAEVGHDTMHDLLKHLDAEEPSVPAELVQYLLRSVGAGPEGVAGPEGLSLVGKAAEHFIGSVLNDARLLWIQKYRHTAKKLMQLGINGSNAEVLSTEESQRS